jgi:hypothetical protein
MKSLFAARCHVTAHPRAKRSVARAAALLAFCLLALPATASAVTPVYTWQGQASSSTPQWSNVSNWSGTAPTKNSAGAFSFPTLTGCTSSMACYHSDNDLTGITADSLTFNPSGVYQLYGNSLTLGPAGATYPTTLSFSTSGAEGFARIATPISVDVNQTWEVTGDNAGRGVYFGPYPGAGDSSEGTGDISGTNGSDYINANIGQNGALTFDSSVEVGTVDADGFSGAYAGSDASINGTLTVANDLNGTDGNPVNLLDVAMVAEPDQNGGPSTIKLGPLSTDTSSLQIGGSDNPAGEVDVNGGVTLDSGTPTTFEVNSSGTTAGTSYAQLSASGNVALAGTLNLSNGQADGCTSYTLGQSDTLITTTGALTGTFANAPQGAVVNFPGLTASGQSCPPVYARINYTSNAVTATFVNTTTALSVPPSPATTNQPVTLTATVTPLNGGTPAGTVSFTNDGATISGCSAQPVSTTGSTYTATCETTFAATQGSASLSATFTPSDSTSFSGSSSSTESLPVDRGSSTTELSTSSATPKTGQSITYTASVAAGTSGPAAPGGRVEFRDGGAPITGCGGTSGEVVSARQATCTTSYTSAGQHSVSATYTGDANFTGSSSTAVKVSVSAAAQGGTGTAHVGSVKTSGTTASASVSCAAGGPGCTVTALITATETLKGNKVVGVSAIAVSNSKRKHKKGKTRKKVVVLGKARVTLAAGQHRTVKVSLNRSGKKLLAKHKHLKTKLKVTSKTAGGKTKTVASKTVTFKQPKKHKKKK